MSATTSDGIAYSTTTKAAYVMEPLAGPKDRTEVTARPWAYWGDANNLPVLSFNSSIVQLKGQNKGKFTAGFYVSIPLWYN